MKSRIIAVTLVALSLLASPAAAQVTVYGQVFGDSGVLEWAFVRWYGTAICDTTCPFGNWMLMNLPAQDSVKLEVWHAGYYSQTCWTRPGTCDFNLVKLPAGQVEQVGDFNLNGAITAADIVAMVGMVFRRMPGPLWPPAADFTCDGQVTAADIVGQVNFVFKAGQPAACNSPAGARTTYSGSPAGC
jgi:hypothetical protein